MRPGGPGSIAAALALLALLPACSGLPRPPSTFCLPIQSFDQEGSGWYYRELDGTLNSGLWRGGAGLGGTGALVLPPGVDVILRDGPLHLPRESLCFLGRTEKGARAVATVGWLRRSDTAACAGSGCFLTQFPPRPPCPTRRAGPGRGSPAGALGGFDLYHFPAATVQGPRCDVPEVTFIAVRHEGEFVIDSLGVLVGNNADCLATCGADADCNDADPCTADTCLAGSCRNELACAGPSVAEIPAASDIALLLLALLLATAAVRRLHC